LEFGLQTPGGILQPGGSGAQLEELYSWAGGEGVFIEAVNFWSP